MAMEPSRDVQGNGLADVIDRILDKGLVINADIAVSVVGVELLGIKIRAALASFETAARYGMEFPSGTTLQTPAWEEAAVQKDTCPQCEKKVAMDDLMTTGCPWCGWVSAKAKEVIS
jgi:ribosomal protein L37AE/L43A